ncbi:MAG TPA: serine hydrolase [Candidatus Saccharimonadales bacterium]|nr:serine hydrolase [Candidatus Saccharimonadales bacterium]
MVAKRTRNTLLLILAGILLSVLGVFAGTFYVHRQEESCYQQHNLLNSGVVCGNPPVLNKSGYAGLRDDLEKYINQKRADGHVERVSVYFRDLHNGPVLGINELEAFAPASLLKLPLAMIYLKGAEAQPGLLSHQLRYVGNTTVDLQNFKPTQSAKPGQPYPIEELLRMMISYSDNASFETLNQYMTSDARRNAILLQELQELGIIAPEDRLDEVVSTRRYSSLFRILYNVSYLDEELSKKMLTWLTSSDFNQGLESGVPQDIKIAHKFGERFADDSDLKQLHDCGIVYYPDNPYLLCIMTKGDDWGELSTVIATISEMTHKEVDSRRLP